MKDIKTLLNKIEKEEKTVEKIAIFLKTKRGQKFVSKIYTQPLAQLCKMYNAPGFMQMYKSSRWNRNLIFAAIKKYNVTIPSYTDTAVYINTWSKTPVRLTKKETKEMNARRPKKLGFAAQMHAYEEYACEKFKKKHPAPTEKELKEDLFPEELKRAWETMMDTQREYIRKVIVSKYHKLTVTGRFKTSNNTFSEIEIGKIKDYCMAGHDINNASSTSKLLRKVVNLANEQKRINSNLVCVRIYDHTMKKGRIILPTI